MASALRRNPKRRRVWYAPERQPIPRLASVDELVARAYAEGGPKHGLRRRRDAIGTLVAGYRYLHVRAAREESADYACTAEDTILGLAHELSRRSAKAWDPALGRGLAPAERRELLLRRRGRALAKLLDELAGCGLLVWGGERDNNGLWWRLRIRLIDPDGPPVEAEPWMRPSGRLTDPDAGSRGPSGGERACNGGGGHPYERPPQLEALYDRLVALGRERPALSPALERRIVAATGRFAAHVDQRPAGVGEDPWMVLRAQIEQFTADWDGDPLVRALPLFDALTRRMQAASENGLQDARGDLQSRNCAAPFQDKQNGLTTTPDDPPASASRTGARELGESDGRTATATAEKSPAQPTNDKLGREGGATAPDLFEGLAGRVAARERLLQALSGPARAQDAETLRRARSWPSRSRMPVGLLTAAVAVLEDGPRPWLSDDQVERLRRGEARYARHARHRPSGAPDAPAAALLALVEQRPAAINQPLSWAIAQLDLLTKRMRRDAKRDDPGRLEAARRRAERRQAHRRDAATCFWRRPGGRRQVAVDDAVDRLAARVTGNQMRRPLAWTLAHTAQRLQLAGVAVTAEQLRRELRDQLLLARAPAHHLAELDGPATRLPGPERFDPSQAQLHPADVDRLAAREWLLRQRDRDLRRRGSERGQGCSPA